MALNGPPPGDFPLPIFSTVLNGITVRRSIVGKPRNLQESLDFAAHAWCARIRRDRLASIDDVFAKPREGTVDGRIAPDALNKRTAPRDAWRRAAPERSSSHHGAKNTSVRFVRLPALVWTKNGWNDDDGRTSSPW